MAKKKSNQPIIPVVHREIAPRPIVQELHESYLEYAMSVIVSRALPDARDGLKPVHRRILYVMHELGLRHSAKYRKSAAVVGDVLGKYHPHGDSAVYDAMVHMAQDFSLRYPLVDGQGNFGSMDGDSAAAMRYTESRMSSPAEELLADLEKETVDWRDNYDATRKEPVVLPSKLPNLLLNGTLGIAVGMATNIPPHNLVEVIDAATHIIDNPDASVEDLLEFVKGPDFPTGGIIYDKKAIAEAYATGRGAVVIRARAEIVEEDNGFRIIVTELPFQVNKATLLEKIAELVKDKRVEGIRDLRDESGKEGVRVVIELKRDAYPKKVLNKLYKLTSLQTTFHYNMLALVDGLQPRVLTLKELLDQYLTHRRSIILSRTKFDLRKAEERAHILEGLHIALDKIDAVIKTIRESKDKEVAKQSLMKKFKLSELQAVAILEMRLQNLANLERLRIEDELKEKRALIKELKDIIASPKRVAGIIKTELGEMKAKYNEPRRTEVMPNPVDEFSAEDLIPNEPAIVVITRDGYIKRLKPDTFKAQGRGGKGVIGLATKEEDLVEHLFSTTTHSDMFFFTTRGRVFQLKAYDVPEASRTSKGQAVVNFLQLGESEKVSSILPLEDLKEYKFLVMITRNGIIKKVEINAFEKVRRSGLNAINLKDGDALEWVKPTTGKDDVMLVTMQGQSIRFQEKLLRPMGRGAAGVRGMRLKGKDAIVGMAIVEARKDAKKLQLTIVMENGFGKRTDLGEYKVQGRGGSGIKTARITDKTGPIVAGMVIDAEHTEQEMMIISEKGQVIRFPAKDVSEVGRDTQGVRLMRFKEEGDKVASVTML